MEGVYLATSGYEHCVEKVLTCGQYIKRSTFPDHVKGKLVRMLGHCSNLVELSISIE